MKANIRVKRLRGKKMKSCKQINAQILEVKTFFFFYCRDAWHLSEMEKY